MDRVRRTAHIPRRPTHKFFLRAYNIAMFSSLFVLVGFVVSFAAGMTYVFQDDCAKSPGPCNNDCYAIFTAGVSDVPTAPQVCSRNILTEIQRMSRKQGASGGNRKAAGCVPNPCGSKINKPTSGETSCDEYPFAGTSQGGQGSLLRCTTPSQNTGEGGALGRFFQKYCGTKNCEFIMSFQNSKSS
jgi:hypothetical protein